MLTEPGLDRDPAAAVGARELVHRLARVEGGREAALFLPGPARAGAALRKRLALRGRRLPPGVNRTYGLEQRPHGIGMLVRAVGRELLARRRVNAVRECVQDSQRLFLFHGSSLLLSLSGRVRGPRGD
jgi:hypothetical protein